MAQPVIHHGDALAVLRTMASGSVQTCVTSPPYWGLRDYGVKGQLGLEKTPEAYVARLVEVFREVRRVLKDDGTCWINLGDSYASGEVGRHDSVQANDGRDWNGTRKAKERQQQPVKTGLAAKNLVGIPWRVAFALQADGWILRSDIIWHKPNPMPESVRDRPTKAHEYLFLFAKSAKYFYDAKAIREDAVEGKRLVPFGNKNATARNVKNLTGNMKPGVMYQTSGHRNRRTVWTITPKPFKGAHFATFPPALVEPCVLAGSRPGDTVLDPFSGAGTTCMVAESLGRVGVGIELNAAYIAISETRLKAAA